MVFLKVLLLILTFNELIVDLDAKICPKGFKATGDSCVACRKGYYQDEESNSIFCKPCTLCEDKLGSMVEQECTPVTDRKCKCREGFVSWENDPSICKCKSGFESKGGKVCSECADGHFSHGTKPCKRWKDCKSAGVKSNGTKTSDVICNDELKSNVPTAPPRTYTKIISVLRSTTHRPPEGAQTLKMQTTTIAAAPPLATLRGKEQPSNTGNHIGIALLLLAIIGLVVLTIVTWRLNITPCWEKKTAVPKQDSFCGRPVEESGDDSSSSLKLNPGEP
ncbi:tumor necrosis factor receptor superfamily member 4 [Amphiprion ocellaris]|uniref:TNFR-Cys domain-containing protein n=2 Tax=Amphiprion ocellaris TaxID=80972 RepID=A0A3Q1CQR9_AMPOC|nr:tumor necrosis factor receptor superfamily member 4 [Amphiprion ocellaris]